MAQTGNEFDIFSMSVDDLEVKETRQTGSDLYRPKPDNGKNGMYESLIRFLPNLKNPRKPYVRKYTYWLEDSDGKGFSVDSPSTIGEKCSYPGICSLSFVILSQQSTKRMLKC